MDSHFFRLRLSLLEVLTMNKDPFLTYSFYQGPYLLWKLFCWIIQGMVSNCFGYHPPRMKKFKILRRYQQPTQIGSSLFLQLIRGKQPLSKVVILYLNNIQCSIYSLPQWFCMRHFILSRIFTFSFKCLLWNYKHVVSCLKEVSCSCLPAVLDSTFLDVQWC